MRIEGRGCKSSRRKEIRDCRCADCTQVAVRDLFYNAPARRKFLKSPLRETELIQKTIVTYALAYPHIAFRFIADGAKLKLAHGTPLERIGAVWDVICRRNDRRRSREIDLHVRVLSRVRRWRAPAANGSCSSSISGLFDRVVGGHVGTAIRRAFAAKPASTGCHSIEVDPQLVDVNVHPRKAEVRFYQERASTMPSHMGRRRAARFPLCRL